MTDPLFEPTPSEIAAEKAGELGGPVRATFTVDVTLRADQAIDVPTAKRLGEAVVLAVEDETDGLAIVRATARRTDK